MGGLGRGQRNSDAVNGRSLEAWREFGSTDGQEQRPLEHVRPICSYGQEEQPVLQALLRLWQLQEAAAARTLEASRTSQSIVNPPLVANLGPTQQQWAEN